VNSGVEWGFYISTRQPVATTKPLRRSSSDSFHMQYLGEWFEQKAFPAPFQDHYSCVRARYTLMGESGCIWAMNSCIRPCFAACTRTRSFSSSVLFRIPMKCFLGPFTERMDLILVRSRITYYCLFISGSSVFLRKQKMYGFLESRPNAISVLQINLCAITLETKLLNIEKKRYMTL
jgi:lipocalin